MNKPIFLSILCLLALTPMVVLAQEDPSDNTSSTVTTAPPAVNSNLPQLLGLQVTAIDQHLYSANVPYGSNLTLPKDGNSSATFTYGVYLGWEPLKQIPHLQAYLDLEQFQGNGINNATGLADLTDGDSIRSGSTNLPKEPYVARKYIRYYIPIGDSTHTVENHQDRLGGTEPDSRIVFKFGTLAVNDDFDKNRYANSTRTQFMNWSLFNNTSWDFAADTRGYTTGFVAAWLTPKWSLHYGIYEMPKMANGQQLCSPITHCYGQQLEYDWFNSNGMVIRLLGFQNFYNGGNYNEALQIASLNNTTPSIQDDDKKGRHKYGFSVNMEQPLANNGETGVFARVGINDGKNESFVFTEVDQLVSLGGQLSGANWGRQDDHFGVGYSIAGLSASHEEYLAHGGEGFVIGDGKLNYGHEKALEVYYNYKPFKFAQISPDFQYIQNPGYNKDMGSAKVIGIRVHFEY